MPYIDKKQRPTFEEAKPLGAKAFTPGQLNYVLTMVCLGYLRENERDIHYQEYSEIIGALECCKLEFYRRKLVSFEDKKIVKNGDVY